ncbi:MAG: hypothetical protein N2423_10165, partial [Novosphingobium sp.]|nr:hypothetical protein [Novosphingobium sp.]
MAEAEQKLAAARSAGNLMEIDIYQYQLDNLLRQGASGWQAEQAARLAHKVAELDPSLVKAAREAGVDVESIASTAANAQTADLALLKAVAQARGWHDIPKWASDPISNTLINARKILAGVADARIAPQDLELLRSLRTYVESRGINFAEYLATAAGEVGFTGKEAFTGIGGIPFERTVDVIEGIVRYYDAEDIDLLLKVLDAGGDAAKLRRVVNPVTQASLNGLGRAAQAGGSGCSALDAGLTLQRVGDAFQVAENLASGANASTAGKGAPAPDGATAPGSRPTDAQLENVLSGTGQLGRVGLGNVVDQFGVTDRFTEGQSLPRAMLGELWEFITSPAATTASLYYTYQAQGQYLDLLKNEHDRLVQLGTQLGYAARALRDLQATLQRAGLSGPGSYLGTTGPAELRRALDNLESIYNSGSDSWKKNRQGEMDARRKHIEEKLAALAETLADLNALAARMGNVVNWLESLRRTPSGGLRGPVELFDPQIFVRLGSIALYLRGMG